MTELLPHHVRRQLAALRRGGRAEASAEAGAEAPPRETPIRPGGPCLRVRAPERAAPTREVTATAGACASLRLEPGETHPALQAWLARAAQELGALPVGAARRHGALYLDLETLGFAGQPLFLVGMLHAGPGGFHVHQFLARDYSEEAAVLEVCRPLVEQAECLVTYNGRTFDWPFLVGRYRYHLQEPPPAPRHWDLLPVARALHRGRLPNCALGTVESHVLGIEREGDVPGSAIPELYHRAVAEENPQLLAPVLYHNQVDLLSLACLAGRWREYL